MDSYFRQIEPLLLKGENCTESDVATIITWYKTSSVQDIESLCAKRKILPFAAKSFVASALDVPYWSGIIRNYRSRNKRILDFLNTLYSKFMEKGVQKIFVSENMGALLVSNSDIALFSSGDVDNCAHIEEKNKIYAAAYELGCAIRERYSGHKLITAIITPPMHITGFARTFLCRCRFSNISQS